MFSVVVKTENLDRKFDTLALAARDLRKPLGQFGGYLRKKAIAKYQAQAFAPLARATLEKRAGKGLQSLEGKLHRDLKKAIARARAPGQPKGLLAQLLGGSIGAQDLSALDTRGVRNRMAVLAEFQRRNRPGGTLAQRADLKPLSLKQVAGLNAREARAVSRTVQGPILGKLATSLVVEVEGGSVTLASRVKGHWTAVHNEGGTAGHGATIPQRETIVLEESDLDVFEEILVEHHLLAPLREE